MTGVRLESSGSCWLEGEWELGRLLVGLRLTS